MEKKPFELRREGRMNGEGPPRGKTVDAPRAGGAALGGRKARTGRGPV